MTAWIYAYEGISMYLHLEGLNCRWLLETPRPMVLILCCSRA